MPFCRFLLLFRHFPPFLPAVVQSMTSYFLSKISENRGIICPPVYRRWANFQEDDLGRKRERLKEERKPFYPCHTSSYFSNFERALARLSYSGPLATIRETLQTMPILKWVGPSSSLWKLIGATTKTPKSLSHQWSIQLQRSFVQFSKKTVAIRDEWDDRGVSKFIKDAAKGSSAVKPSVWLALLRSVAKNLLLPFQVWEDGRKCEKFFYVSIDQPIRHF